MTSTLILIALTLAVSMAYPIQPGINGTLSGYIGHGLSAALVNTSVATLALIVVCVVFRVPVQIPGAISAAPWWAWTGGLFGATFVFASLTLAPKLGAAAFVATATVGTMIASLIIDHYGLFGYRQEAVTPYRVLGVLMVIGGMMLFQLKR